MVKKALLLIPLMVMAVGCSNNDAPGGDDDTFYSYETNQNPNSYRLINSPRPVISDDQDKIRAAVQDASGINPQWVSIIGNNVYVHVNVPDNYSDKQRDKLEKKLVNAITDSVPRYTIHLRFDES